jgi:tryptophanase
MPTNTYLQKDITNDETGVMCPAWKSDKLEIDTMSFVGTLNIPGYADAQMIADDEPYADVRTYTIANCAALTSFNDIFTEIVGMMIGDAAQGFYNAVLKNSETAGQYFEISIEGDDGITRSVWQANGKLVVNLKTDKAHLIMNGYPSLAILEAGGTSTDRINYIIDDVFDLTYFQNVYNEIITEMTGDSTQDFKDAALVSIPAPS